MTVRTVEDEEGRQSIVVDNSLFRVHVEKSGCHREHVWHETHCNPAGHISVSFHTKVIGCEPSVLLKQTISKKL